MTSNTPEQNLSSLTLQRTVVKPISTLSVMYFVYGLYVALFGAYIHIMCGHASHANVRSSRLYLTITVALFVFSTIFVANQTLGYVHVSVIRFNAVKEGDYNPLSGYENWNDVVRRASNMIADVIPVVLNIGAECMLIHRCYLIWNRSKQVVVPFTVASLSINALGLSYSIVDLAATSAMARNERYSELLLDTGRKIRCAYMISNATVNLLLTLLTAGRIWVIYRQACAYNIRTNNKLYRSVSKSILESGIIYPIVNIAYLIISHTIPLRKLSFDSFPLLPLSAGIAPTLIVVRAKLDRNVHETQQRTVSGIHFQTNFDKQPSRVSGQMSHRIFSSIGKAGEAAMVRENREEANGV